MADSENESAIAKAKNKFAQKFGGRSPFIDIDSSISIIVKGNEYKIEIRSFIEDFKQDCEYFLDLARKAKQANDIIIEKRFLKTAYLTITNFFEASVNHFCKITLSQAKEKRPNRFWFNFYTKCNFLEKRYLNIDIFPKNEKGKFKNIRNQLVHFKGKNTNKLWDKMTLDNVEQYLNKCLLWIEVIKHNMSLQTSSSEEIFNSIAALMERMGVKITELK